MLIVGQDRQEVLPHRLVDGQGLINVFQKTLPAPQRSRRMIVGGLAATAPVVVLISRLNKNDLRYIALGEIVAQAIDRSENRLRLNVGLVLTEQARHLHEEERDGEVHKTADLSRGQPI